MEQERASNDQLWFEWPRSERLNSARRWMDVPLSRLALSARPYNALMRSRFYASVGDLMLAGDEVRLVRNLGELSLRQIHDVLAPELALAVPEKTVEADGSGLGVAHAQYDSLRVLATMGTYSVDPWHGIRPMLRSAAAAAFRGCATARLPIDRQTAEAVAAVRRFGTVAALIEGDETALCREFPVDVRQQIHEALRSASLRYFEATFILPELTLALDQLRLREDLWSLNLNHLAWSDDLRALAAGLFADTLGDLCQHSSERIAATACHDAGLLGGLVDELRTTVNMPPGAEGVDWARLWRDRGVRVFPDPDGPWVVAEAASELLGLHLSERLSDRHAEVLRHRLGLDGAEVYTLEELGGVYGVTRERIRQIETKAKSVSGRFLSDVESWPEVVAPAQLDPGLLEAWHDLLETVRECANAPMPERELRDRSNRVLRTESEEVHPLVGLVAAAGRVRRSSARYGAGSVWHHQSRSVGALLRRMEAVSRFLTTVTARSYSPLELTVHMNRASGSGDRLTVEDVQEALGLCELVERLDDGRYQGRFEHLRPRLLRAERVLREAAQPLHLAHIAREINHRVTPLGLRRVKVPSLSNQMASDDRYVPIGRSGYWALSEWPDIETGTVLELMERCFVEENTALSSRAIYEYVSGRRPVSFNSILLYLSGDDRFAPLEGDMWVLSSWPEAKRAERWNRRGLADFVGRYFAQRGQERVPLEELVSVVSGSARISEDVAREMLLVSPALEIVEDDQGILTAISVSGYRKALEDPVGQPRVRMRRYELLARRTVEELERRPAGEMPLSELRELLTKELDIPDPTFYAYIARVDAIETLPWPGHVGKRIRLVDRDE